MKGIPSELEYKTLPSEPTPRAFTEMGAVLGTSPERMRAAFNRAVPTNNFLLDLAGRGWRQATEDLSPYQQSLITEEVIARTPGLRSVVKLSHPAVNQMDQLEEMAREALGEKKVVHDKLNEMYALHKAGTLSGGKDTVMRWINTQPPEEREGLVKGFRTKEAVDQIFARYTATSDIPDRTWWERSSALPPEARAAVFYDRWISATPENRKQMEIVAARMSQFGVGYMSQEFRVEFLRHKNKLGTDKR
jgi:hypothetical protein